MSDFMQEIKQLHKQATAELAGMKWQVANFERYEDYERGYANGYGEAFESFNKLVSDIAKILRTSDINEVMTSSPIVNENQLPLPTLLVQSETNQDDR